MATLALSLAGQVVGGAVGGPIGATIGRALGALAGSAVDSMLFAEKPATRQTPAGADIRLQGSSEGGPIPRLYGWGRLTGNIIWATELEEVTPEAQGGKGAPPQQSEPAETTILASFAVGLCEGEVHRLGRVWAGGQVLETAGLTLRFYRGTESQEPDSLIEAKQGDDAPAYRGLCYLVFERLPIGQFGNRIPNISVELCRVVGELEPAIKAVTVIPGATEFGYDPVPRVRIVSPGATANENTHLSAAVADWTLSIDELQALCPNLEHVSLVVAWFGDDLRCGECAIAPRVEASSREISGATWSVAGISRGGAQVVTSHDGGPAYGGTPSDAAVRAAIADLTARGLSVTLYPMLLMDIPAGNVMGQPAYPWRGRISCSAGVDGTGTAASEVADFVAGYRSFILHYAQLAEDAGGVEAFVIGSEMRGLTTVRGAANTFPFVAALVDLAADVKAIVGTTKLTYAADWSEFSGYQPAGGDRFFHLDPLWASDDTFAVGIDSYMPVADWREGEHADAELFEGPYDPAYLGANIEGGEGFDWHYASDADRLDGIRTPITDGMGEPWIWRFKDIASWWGNAHHERVGGVRSPTATDWVPEGKPVWFTELGCGAVDKGANQPNVFVDPKSAESGKPYFSNGAPDPLLQRQVLRAHLDHWAGSPMVERIYLWTWDARPFPAFPMDVASWSDGPNYATGHWLTGRAGALASDEMARAIAADYGVDLGEVAALPPLVHGMALEGSVSLRDALAPVLAASGLSIRDTPEGLALGRTRGRDAVEIDEVVDDERALISRRRPDPGEEIGQVALSYLDRERGYLAGTVTAMRLIGGVAVSEGSGLVLDLGGARAAAERMLLSGAVQRDSIELSLPQSMAALEVGDAIAIAGQGDGPFEITEIRDGLARKISARAIPPVLNAAIVSDRPGEGSAASVARALPIVAAAHLPPDPATPGQSRLVLAASAQPWPGDVAVTDELSGTSVARLTQNAAMGELLNPLEPGGIYCWDIANDLHISLYSGHLASKDDEVVLAGGNRIAVETDSGDWEVIGFAEAELVALGEYRLTRLLRGQLGTDFAIGATAAGNRILVLDDRPSWLPVPAQWLGGEIDLRAYAGRHDAEGAAFSADIGLDPLLPLAPAHLLAVRPAGSNDIAITWLRRSRADADNWAAGDAPHDNLPEAYRLTVFDGPDVVREIDCATASVTYTAAQQTADFGNPPSGFAFTITQLSPVFGRGHAASGIFAD
jgi:hypothetical protein